MFASIQETNFWLKWQDLIWALSVTFGLIGFYVLLHILDDQDWTLVHPDYTYDVDYATGNSSTNATNDSSYLNDTDCSLLNDSSYDNCTYIYSMTFSDYVQHYMPMVISAVIALSLVTTPLAAYFSATNDRLSWPIRLLATAENINKFIYALSSCLSDICSYFDLCPEDLRWSFYDVSWTLTGMYSLCDVAQYCQCLISLSRFLVLSLDGAYFRYTTKLPIIQLLIPYALRVAFAQIEIALCDYSFQRIVHEFLITMPYFLTCGLDFVTDRKVKTLKKNGRVSRVECLLMLQMVTNSCMTVINFIIYYMCSLVTYLFFGYDVWIVFSKLRILIQVLLFNLVSSLISVLFLRKPKDREPRSGVAVTVTSVAPTAKRTTMTRVE
ncbi:unnamed protein product, partial [Mesorhabditis belari]|uniref:Uncharacterized protein n=1 Tax=Mesorhabditis belari TaxID=2138241 RepID=A0AAF3ES46_9BILA